jgi:hypothetical protein
LTGISDTVTEYFRREVAAAGYALLPEGSWGPAEVAWSLGHRPGDGVAFFGSLGGEGLLALSKRVMAAALPGAMDRHEKGAATKALKAGRRLLRITRRAAGTSYRGMQIGWEGPGAPEGATPMQSASLRKLMAAIMADAMRLCCRLENEGYAILEATQPALARGGKGGPPRGSWRRSHGGCLATITLEPDGSFEPYRRIREDSHGFVRGMAAGDNVVYQVRAEIVSATGELLGQARLSGVTDRGDLRGAPAAALRAFAGAKEMARARGPRRA